MHTFSSYAEVRAALTDPYLVPLPAPEGAPVGTMSWLRSQVARFSAGPDHARRRTMAVADLATVDLARLNAGAASAAAAPSAGVAVGPDGADGDGRHAEAAGGASGRHAEAAGGADERRVVVAVLAEALGLAEPDAVADAVVAASVTYFGGEDAGADRAVGWLLGHVLAGIPEAVPDRLERAANRIALLIQAVDATATLVVHTRAALGAATGTTAPPGPDAVAASVGAPKGPTGVAAALARTLRDDPPVRVMRRRAVRATRVGEVTVAEGEEVALDVAAASRESGETLTFGMAPRVCPGREHALAIAAGRLGGHPFGPVDVP